MEANSSTMYPAKPAAPSIPAARAALTASCLTSALARASSWRISVDRSWVTSPTSSPTEAAPTSRPPWPATAAGSQVRVLAASRLLPGPVRLRAAVREAGLLGDDALVAAAALGNRCLLARRRRAGTRSRGSTARRGGTGPRRYRWRRARRRRGIRAWGWSSPGRAAAGSPRRAVSRAAAAGWCPRCWPLGAGRVGHAPGQASSRQARGHSAGQEHARAATGEVPDRLQQVGGLTLLEPGSRAVNTFGRLLRDLGGHAGLAALGRHLLQFVRNGAELARGLLLLDGGLVSGLARWPRRAGPAPGARSRRLPSLAWSVAVWATWLPASPADWPTLAASSRATAVVDGCA